MKTKLNLGILALAVIALSSCSSNDSSVVSTPQFKAGATITVNSSDIDHPIPI